MRPRRLHLSWLLHKTPRFPGETQSIPRLGSCKQPPPTHPTAPKLARPETLDCLDNPEKRLLIVLGASFLPIASNSQHLSFPISSLGKFPSCRRRSTQNMLEECNISSPHARWLPVYCIFFFFFPPRQKYILTTQFDFQVPSRAGRQ